MKIVAFRVQVNLMFSTRHFSSKKYVFGVHLRETKNFDNPSGSPRNRVFCANRLLKNENDRALKTAALIYPSPS